MMASLLFGCLLRMEPLSDPTLRPASGAAALT